MALSALNNYAAAGPACHAAAVTPSDTVPLANATRALWVGTAGSGGLTVLMNGDTVPVTIPGVPAGKWLDISVIKVMSTGTTVSNIVGLY